MLPRVPLHPPQVFFSFFSLRYADADGEGLPYAYVQFLGMEVDASHSPSHIVRAAGPC